MKFILLFLLITDLHAEFIYRATTQIGDQTFQDIIVLNEMPFSEASLAGSLTVPGHFSTPLLPTSKLKVALWADMYFLTLNVAVTENNQTSLLTYKLKSQTTGYQNLVGELLDQENQMVGTITEMRLIYESNP